MNNIIDLLIIGGGPAGLMTAKTAIELGLKVTLVEKNKDFQQLRRACSAQFILDDGYENEFINLKDEKILFTKNNFEVNYTGKLVKVKNKYYTSPKGHRIHFALPNQKAFAVKFDKQKLLYDLYNECVNLGVDVRMSTLACGGSDKGNYVSVDLKGNTTYTLNAKKVVIAEGANAKLTGLFGLNKGRVLHSTPLVFSWIVEGATGFKPQSWNQFYGSKYHPFAEVIIESAIEGTDAIEITIMGTKALRPDVLFKKFIKNSPMKHNFTNSHIIEKKRLLPQIL